MATIKEQLAEYSVFGPKTSLSVYSNTRTISSAVTFKIPEIHQTSEQNKEEVVQSEKKNECSEQHPLVSNKHETSHLLKRRLPSLPPYSQSPQPSKGKAKKCPVSKWLQTHVTEEPKEDLDTETGFSTSTPGLTKEDIDREWEAIRQMEEMLGLGYDPRLSIVTETESDVASIPERSLSPRDTVLPGMVDDSDSEPGEMLTVTMSERVVPTRVKPDSRRGKLSRRTKTVLRRLSAAVHRGIRKLKSFSL